MSQTLDDTDKLIQRVQRVFREVLDDDSLEITEHIAQADVPEWDSMFQITLILAIEKEFDLRLVAKDAGQLVTVRAILDLLSAKKVKT